jgi:hypothetical protein
MEETVTSTPSSTAKGKQRAEVPIVELRILPITDAINMFGSTQTSSNYSLSGKIVVRVHNIIHEMPSGRRTSNKKASDGSVWLPEINTDTIFLDPDQFLANYTVDDVGDDYRVQEIKITSLRCTFAGYALYVDHSGRFAACKLTEVTEDLLPQGYTVQIPQKGRSLEYEIEFNLSVPGWLPSTHLSRFGGTFYSLEANAKYSAFDSEQQHAIPSSLVPPRRASIMPSFHADEGLSNESKAVPLRWKRSQHFGENDVGASPRTAKTRSESTPVSASNGKTTWLSKRAKQLSSKAKSQSSDSSTSLSSSAPSSQPASSLLNAPPRLYASRDFLSAFSDPIVIVVRRCREVVPVPVARMAIVEQGGTDCGATIDPPVSARQRPLDEIVPDSHVGLLGPPVAPTTFSLPFDPAKAAVQVAASARAPVIDSSGRNSATTGQSPEGAVQMRHFLHRPLLHPPVEAKIPNAEAGLPFSLTLSLPSYVAIDGPGSDILSFGVQIEVSRSSTWQRVRELGGLRLRDMELSCIQTERHCSVASRNFCHAYPLPPDPHIGPFDLPIFGAMMSKTSSGRLLTHAELRQRRGYDRDMVQHHVNLMQAGQAPQQSANNVERVRTTVVGPPPTPSAHRMGKATAPAHRGKGKANAQEREVADLDSTAPEDASANELASAQRTSTGRGRRAYQTAMRGLSNLATAVMDISLDMDSGYNAAIQGEQGNAARNGADRAGHGEGANKRSQRDDSERAALYSFAGSDGHGVDLTRGRVRMAIKLPLVKSSRSEGGPQLVPDFESPFMKTRHKLQVKLGFGFGSKPLGGEGEWGQSLVMCVPVRFTESAPREVREQFAPMPIRQVAMGPTSALAAQEYSAQCRADLLQDLPHTQDSVVHATPVLPSYNQIFREDGSRLADEGEDLPQYPGPRIVVPSMGGSVTAARDAIEGTSFDGSRSAEAAVPASEAVNDFIHARLSALQMNERSSSLPGTPAVTTSSNARAMLLNARMHSFDNRIAPSHVLDESIPPDLRGQPSSRAMQRLEMEELHRDVQEEEERRHRQSLTTAEGLRISVDDRNGGMSSGQEDEGSGSGDDAMLQGETVNVGEFEDGMDGEIPAYSAPSADRQREDMTFTSTSNVTPLQTTHALHPSDGGGGDENQSGRPRISDAASTSSSTIF